MTKHVPGLINIYDADNDEWVEITNERRMYAATVISHIQLGAFVMARAIKKVFDEKLYLAAGCQSKEEFCATYLPFGMRQAQKYYKVISTFETKLLPEGILTGDDSSNTLDNANLSSHEELGKIGIANLYELTKMDDEDLKDLLDGKKVGELSIEEINEMTTREIALQVKKSTRQYQEKLKKVSTEKQILEEDVKLLKSERDAMTEENKIAKEIEKQFGAVASKLKDKVDHIDQGRVYLNKFFETMLRCGVGVDDPESVKKDLVDIIRKADEVHQRLIDEFGEVTAEF